MSIFNLNAKQKSYNKSSEVPAIKSSICTGECVAGFKDIKTGKFSDVMLIKSSADLEKFKKTYGINGEIEKIY